MIVYTSYGAAVYHREKGTIPGLIPAGKDDHMLDPNNSPYRIKALGWNTLIHDELTLSKLMGTYQESTLVLIRYLLKQFPKP